MEDYEGVIIWDLPSQIRNKYLKYCFLSFHPLLHEPEDF